MKIVSWNVNGIRASMDKGFREYVERDLPEIICLQETKAHRDQVNLNWVEAFGYHQVWNSAKKKGYSGTAIWSRTPPKKEKLGLGIDQHDQEGRVITASFDDFHLVTVYTPNSQRGLARLEYRQKWDQAFLDYVKKLNRRKPVIFCGDLNCAHQEIDLANPKSNRRNAGFTDEERAGLDRIVDAGFVDSFREFNSEGGQYSWWTYRLNARERNVGWRLDYFFIAEKLMPRVKQAAIRQNVFGSDHCPVEIELE